MFFVTLRREARLAVLLLALCLLGGLVLYVYARPVFRARAVISIEQSAAGSDAPAAGHRSVSAMRDLQAPHIAERAARTLGLRGSAREIASKYVFGQSFREARDGSIELEVRALSSELARRWPRTLVDELNRSARDLRYQRVQEIVGAYGTELREVAAQLGEPLDPKLPIKNEQDVLRVLGVLEKSAPAELVRIAQRLNDIGKVRINLADSALDIPAKLTLLAPLDPAASGTAPPTWPELAAEQQRLASELEEAIRTEPNDAERVREVTARLTDVQAKLSAAYKELRDRVDGEYRALLARKAELEAKVPEPTSAAQPSNDLRHRAAVATMSRNRWLQMAAEMQRKIEALGKGPSSDVPRLRIASESPVGDSPLSPNPGKVAIASLLSGVVLALGGPALLAFASSIFSSSRRAEMKLKLPRLGTVPGIQDAETADVTEIFGAIHQKLAGAGTPHVVLVSSAVAQEGKTLLAMQLALASARSGTKTLLLDGDLARGRVHSLFGFRRLPGLADILMGAVSPADARRPTTTENLWIIPSGRPVEHGGKLLGSEQFTDLMSALRGEFGCIIIDAPAVLAHSHATLLLRQADGIVLVVRDDTAWAALKSAHEILRVNEAKFLGFVANGGAELPYATVAAAPQ